MNKTLKLLSIYSKIFDKYSNYYEDLKEYEKKYNLNIEYLKLKEYFRIYKESSNHRSEVSDKWIEPIIKINDPKEALSTVKKNYSDFLNKRKIMIDAKVKGINFNFFSFILESAVNIKNNIWEIIEKDIYEININVIEKDLVYDKNEYDEAIGLYWDNHYPQAFKNARDIFQKNLEEKFNSSIKHFEGKEGIEKFINEILKNISNIRNKFAKYNNFESLSKNKQRALTKLSLEQIIMIENFIEILNEN